jgi:peptidoglycan/xylan/chitin deacetylase (PgdA/CDA1 family)
LSLLRPFDRQRLKGSYFRALAVARVDAMLRMLHARRNHALVLNFHRVSPDPNPYWPPLAPEAFASLVAYLAHHCDIVGLDALRNPRRQRRPRVVLSFDDGCRDFVEYAMPVLEKHRVTANQNVIVESIETGRPPWIIQVVDALNAASSARVRALRVDGFDERLEDDDNASKERFGTRLTNFLKTVPPDLRAARCESLNQLISETDPASLTPMMSRAEVIALGKTHDVGCHSYSHEAMADFTDSEFAKDLDRCRAFFSGLELPMRIFAFPYGRFRSYQIATLRASGISHVLLVGERPTAPGNDIHHRITMYGNSPAELCLRAVGHRPVRLAGRL